MSTLLREMMAARSRSNTSWRLAFSEPGSAPRLATAFQHSAVLAQGSGFIATGQAAGVLHLNFAIPTISCCRKRKPVKHLLVAGLSAAATAHGTARRVKTLFCNHRCFGERLKASACKVHPALDRFDKMDVASAITFSYHCDVRHTVPGEWIQIK